MEPKNRKEPEEKKSGPTEKEAKSEDERSAAKKEDPTVSADTTTEEKKPTKPTPNEKKDSEKSHHFLREYAARLFSPGSEPQERPRGSRGEVGGPEQTDQEKTVNTEEQTKREWKLPSSFWHESKDTEKIREKTEPKANEPKTRRIKRVRRKKTVTRITNKKTDDQAQKTSQPDTTSSTEKPKKEQQNDGAGRFRDLFGGSQNPRRLFMRRKSEPDEGNAKEPQVEEGLDDQDDAMESYEEELCEEIYEKETTEDISSDEEDTEPTIPDSGWDDKDHDWDRWDGFTRPRWFS